MKISKQAVLTIFSVVGVAASVTVTAVMAPKAEQAIKAKKLEIAETKEGYSNVEKDRHGYPIKMKSTADNLELVKAAAPYYIPSLLLTVLTIGCIVINHKINSKALLSLSATTSYLVANRDNIKRFVNDNPKAKKLADEAKSYFLPRPYKGQTIEETGNGDVLCIEAYSGRIFRSSPEAVIDAQSKLIDQFLEDSKVGDAIVAGSACMNDYYRYLGISETQFGWEYGWVNDEDWFYKNDPIQFSNEMIAADAPGNEYGEPVYITEIEENWFPIQCWYEI